jgi:hypothetical protein
MRRRHLISLLLLAACTGVYSDPTNSDPMDESHVVTGDKHVFVTSTTYQGGLLGGLAGADDKCATRAAAAGLAGTYKAWLSDSHRSAASRLTHATGRYSLIDGTVVADSWTDLVATNLQHAIDLDELGHTYTMKTTCFVVGGVAPVWTGTLPDGTIYPFDLNCGDWTDLHHDGQVGNILSGDSHWTDSLCGAGCPEHASLYCLEQ